MGAAAAGAAWPTSVFAKPNELLTKPIPSTGERLPVVGMGTWITFNVPADPKLRASRTEVLRTFFDMGGGMVDSSPMYGAARETVGHALGQLGAPKSLFAADKIWTSDHDDTRAGYAESARLWGVTRFDLMQVHNLVAWEGHLQTLRQMKSAGEVRYIGVTTSHGRRHGELAKVMKTQPIDFVQLTYNMVDRDVEKRLLPIAKERGIAIIANRPFQGGALVDRLQARTPVPAWARTELDVHNWPQFLLKWIVSHPTVTCAIPATSQVVHMKENMGAGRGRLPDAALRKRMLSALS